MSTVVTVLAVQTVASILGLSIAMITDEGSRLQRLFIVVAFLPLYLFAQLMYWALAHGEA